MGMFGNSPVYNPRIGTPGIGDGALPHDPRIPAALEPRGIGGMFGGGKLATILGVLGDSLTRQPTYTNHLLQQRQQEQEDARWEKRLGLKAALEAQQPPTPSTAAKMAAEIGLQPGTPQWQQFIRRYAFSPKLVAVGNAQGGEDQVEYDPSGMGDGVAPGTIEDGYRFNGGDPSDPNSWSKL